MSINLHIGVCILHERVLNGGESHVTSIDLTPNLHHAFSFHHFLTLPKVPIKSHYQVSKEEPLINYNKNIVMTNEHYMVALEQKLARKEATTWEQNAQKEELLVSKRVKEVEKKD